MLTFSHDSLRVFSLTAGGAPYCESPELVTASEFNSFFLFVG